MTTQRSIDEIDAMLAASGLLGNFNGMVARECKGLGIDGEDWRRLVSRKEFIREMLAKIRHKVRFSLHVPFGQGGQIPDEGYRALYFLKSAATVDMLLDACNDEGYELLTEDEVARAVELLAAERFSTEMATMRLLNPEAEVYADQEFEITYLNRERLPVRLHRMDLFGTHKPHSMLVRLWPLSEAPPARLLQIHELLFGDLDEVTPKNPPTQWAVIWLRNVDITVAEFRSLLHSNGYRFLTQSEQIGFNRVLLANKVPNIERSSGVLYGYTEFPTGQNDQYLVGGWTGSRGSNGSGILPDVSLGPDAKLMYKIDQHFVVASTRPHPPVSRS